MNLCMSWKQFFGDFQHQDDGGAATQAQRKAALAAIAKRERSMQTQIDKRRQSIRALEAELTPVFMQYRKMSASGAQKAAAQRLFKEKIAPLERRLANEERELKNDLGLLEIGGRVREKDNTGDARGAYLQALQAYTPFVGQRAANTVDGSQADEILHSLTEAQLTFNDGDVTLAQSLSSNLARLNHEDAIDDSETTKAELDNREEYNEENVMRRLNERFQLDEQPPPPPVSATSQPTTTRVQPQPTTPTYRGESARARDTLNFPTPASEPPSRVATGRQAVATAVSLDGTGRPRARHVTFDTDD